MENKYKPKAAFISPHELMASEKWQQRLGLPGHDLLPL